MILYMENSNSIPVKTTVRTNKFNKITGETINLQKLVAFLHTNKEISGKKETISLKLHKKP